jgi:uncharacterized repeat protein (TIGR03803 family)
MRRQPAPTAFALQPIFSAGLLALLVAALVCAVPAAHAQNYSVLHSFANGVGGAWPWSQLTLGNGGHIFGTTFHGGNRGQQACQDDLEEQGCGTVFELYQRNGNWLFNVLYAFQFQNGAYPHEGVIIGRDGVLYGPARTGGLTNPCTVSGCGTVYKVQPSPARPTTAIESWLLNPIYEFTGTDNDGANPSSGLVQDAAGNLYGGNYGGPDNCGVIYQLSRSGGGWTLTDIYNGFYCPEGSVGIVPGGLVFDSAGNLYGTTYNGGHISCVAAQGCGTVFKLTNTGSGWVGTTLYEFNETTDGGFPGGLVMDAAGDLYGGTAAGGPNGGGTVWELSPSNGGWTFNVLHSFQYSMNNFDVGVQGRLAMDASGSLYGVTMVEGAFGAGNLFKLTPSNGSWTYTDLHDFTGGNDGAYPLQGPTLDANGDIFGTTSFGGVGNYGTVWEMTP